jgi:hypothetical protein
MKISQQRQGEEDKQKLVFLLEYRSLLKDVKSALQRTMTTWKNNILFGSVYMIASQYNAVCPYLLNSPCTLLTLSAC